MRRIAALAALGLAWPVASAVAQAPGAPTQTGCLASSPPPADCAGSDLLTGVGKPAYSPDGAQLYVPATSPGTLTIFRRGANGWTPGDCYSATALAGCTQSPALDGAFEAAVSPDGRNVYVTTRETGPAKKPDGVVEFARAADGRLAYLGCINENNPACTALAPLDNAGAITVSPDGTSVYVAAQTSEAVVAFARGPDGTLTFKNCVANAPGTAGCASSNGRFSTPSDLAVSPDGRQVYVSDYNTPYRVVQLDRAGDGALSAPASAPCIAQSGTAGCLTHPALLEGTSLAMSPDGRFVYVTTRYTFATGEAVILIARDPATGAMSLPATGCWRTPAGSVPGCVATPGMEGPGSIVLTPNGRHAYVASIDDRGVLAFDRDAGTGLLTQHANPFGCLVSPSPADPNADGCGTLQGPARRCSPPSRPPARSSSRPARRSTSAPGACGRSR